MGRLTGLLREVTGALTGDRRTEARGRAEEEAARHGGTVSDEQVAEALEEVREEHGDVPLPDERGSAGDKGAPGGERPGAEGLTGDGPLPEP